MLQYFSITVYSLCMLATPLRAFTLKEAIHQAWHQSPQLEAQAKLQRLSEDDVSRRLLPNEPQFQVTRSDDGAAISMGLSLTVGLPGKSLHLRTLDRVKADAQRAELEAKRYDLTRMVTQSYLDCASQQAILSQQTSTLQDQEDLANALKRMYDSGRVTQGETIGAQLQVRQAHSDLITIQDKTKVACQKLQDILRIGAVKKFGSKQEEYSLPDDLDDELLAEIGPFTADELRNRVTIQLAEVGTATATWAQLPDLTISANRNHYLNDTASPSGKPWTTTYGVSFTLPLLYGYYEGAEVRRAASQSSLDVSTAQLAQLQAESDKIDASLEYGRNRSRLAEIQAKDLLLAEALHESMFVSYKSGKTGYAELVIARRTLTDLKAQLVQLKVAAISARLRCLMHCSESAPSPNRDRS